MVVGGEFLIWMKMICLDVCWIVKFNNKKSYKLNDVVGCEMGDSVKRSYKLIENSVIRWDLNGNSECKMAWIKWSTIRNWFNWRKENIGNYCTKYSVNNYRCKSGVWCCVSVVCCFYLIVLLFYFVLLFLLLCVVSFELGGCETVKNL